jgi:hypothetical protein
MTFESFLTAGKPDPRTTRVMRRALALALAVHVVMLVAALVHAGWRVDEISPPTVPITFNGFSAPPPPPPPAAAQSRRTHKVKRRTITTALVQRVEPPDRPPTDEQVTPDTNRDGDGDTKGLPDGIEGCNSAGCIGPPVPPATFVPPKIASGQLAIDPQADAYRVKLPPALNRAGMRLWLLAKLCVRSDGQVERVSLIRGADATLDPLVIAKLKTWRYRPYSVNGRPVPFCTNVRYEIATQ